MSHHGGCHSERSGDNELRLCIGITKAELQFKMKHGSEKLMELLKRHGVHPFTDLERDSVPLG